MRAAGARVAYAAAALVVALAVVGGCYPQQKEKVMTETATFAAGCFWGVEATFRNVPGVVDAAVGYSGGHLDNPTYQDVCTDKTGHAEVVRVTYDPSKVSYEQLLEVFWNCHDPTALNRQGPDVGTQYRSGVFFHSPEQEAAAKASKRRLQDSAPYKGRTVVTEITPAPTFWRAEEYHQRYLEKRGKGTCRMP
jgi:peptide-methionine (S)-S-oxide reductase